MAMSYDKYTVMALTYVMVLMVVYGYDLGNRFGMATTFHKCFVVMVFE